ncbi:hypothetical protein [Stagnihabitans tardus]|uniref:Uncharacterized protein n=1 Tax=Stagnihabitans tardus TaxID=2699202 RepID=A0AAE4Y9Y1_9RHOB|nr:hypothetical protein [Stagnihabitans tardus]NBZ87827.1 hypothetical protein [Stagnihabitans tardus]
MFEALHAASTWAVKLWPILKWVVGFLGVIGAIWDWLALFKGPFRRPDPAHKAAVEALSRPHAKAEARIASHLGTDLESPHISHMTPPPDRPLEDKTDDRA